MSKKQLVLAFFESEAAADDAVTAMKGWDKANKEIKLGAIGMLVKDEKGKVKTHKLGSRKTGAGAVLGVIAAILTGGLSLLGGVAIGGVVGAFFHKGLGISKDELARIDQELNDGRVGVGLLVSADEVDSVSAKLTELGGTPDTYEVSDEAVDQAAMAVEENPSDQPAE